MLPAGLDLFQREHRLLELSFRYTYEAVRRAYSAYLDDRAGVPGFVASIQTFRSFAADFHRHIHAVRAQGALRPDGERLERLGRYIARVPMPD